MSNLFRYRWHHLRRFRNFPALHAKNVSCFLIISHRKINQSCFLTFSMTKQAGVLLLGTGGYIPPNKVEHMETLCDIRENKTIHPFAYRTHTHSLGRVVSGYRVRVDEQGTDHWTRLGKRDPLTPQMFYPVESTEPILYKDRLAARCTMESNRNTITNIG